MILGVFWAEDGEFGEEEFAFNRGCLGVVEYCPDGDLESSMVFSFERGADDVGDIRDPQAVVELVLLHHPVLEGRYTSAIDLLSQSGTRRGNL